MKKLLLDVTPITNDMTGVSRYGIELVRQIVQDHRFKLMLIVHSNLSADHELFVIIRNYNVDIIRLSVEGIGPRREWIFFKLYLKLRDDFDVFHSITSNAPLAFFKKGVGTFHDLKYVLYPKYLGRLGGLKSFFIKWQFAFICIFFKQITTSSSSTLADLLKVYPFLKNKIQSKSNVVYLGLTPLAVEQAPIKNLPTDLPYYVYVGELRPHKNIENMIKAFEIFARRTNFNGRFLIGGKPHKTFSLQSKDERIVFLGRVEDHDLGYLYSHSRGLFFASKYEGFGLPILEAMHLKIPVITSSVSSMPEVGGNACALVNPDNIEEMSNTLELIETNENFRQQLLSQGDVQVKKFSWKRCAEEMMDIYVKV
jgi:glycosyltransferase involved in cell wall biosynthesis